MCALVSGGAAAQLLISCEPLVSVLLVLGGEAVAEPEVRVDEPPPRQRFLELHAKLADIHVNRPVPGPHLPPPNQPEELLTRHDPVSAPRQLCEQAQLPNREHQGSATGAGGMLLGGDLER